jgi:hypothetical protein
MSGRRLALLAVVGGATLACGGLLGLDDEDPAPSPVGPDAAAAASADGAGGADDATTTPVDPEDAGGDAADAGPRKRVVFVTNREVLGDFGGLAAGDTLCNTEAMDAGLPPSFVAWLSVGSGNTPIDAKARLTGDAGWSLVDGGEVFAGPSAIVAGSYPKVGITTDARGRAVDGGTVWTGTRETGERYDQSDCDVWKDPAGAGVRGNVGATDPSWTAAASDYCNQPRRLICFEK